MRDSSDMELVRDYARQNSEAAFAELVQRHVSLVYSAALRHVGIAAQADEITQAVFIILARKAGGLRTGTVIEAWLYETTRLTALGFLRAERRRQFREQEAYMQSTLQESPAADAAWHQIAPLLDDGMMRLGGKEREAVVLRFFKDKNLREVAAGLNISEAAAQKRVHRALEKLRKFFTKRGVDSTAAIIAGAISANSVQAAPVGLAKTVTAVAVAKGAAASTSTLTVIKGALKIMAWTKAKTAIAAATAMILATGVSVVVVQTPRLIQGKTESEWINSIVYMGDDSQMQRWHSLGPRGIQILVLALKPPSDGLTEEEAHTNRVNRMKAASVLCQLENNKLGNDVRRFLPEIIQDIKVEKDTGTLGLELSIFEMPIQSLDEKDKATLFPELLRALQSSDSGVRNNALVALQYYPIQSDAVVPLMLNALQDPVPGVRLEAVRALNQIDPQIAASSNFVAILAGCVAGPPGDMPGAANEAVIMLGKLHRDPDVAIPVLIQSLRSADSYLRENAAAALGGFGGQARAAVTALQKALDDSDARVRRQAANALKHIDSGTAPN